MKKLISLGVVSAMVATMGSASFGATSASKSNVKEIYGLWNGSENISATVDGHKNGKLTSQEVEVNGVKINGYLVEGNNTDKVTLIFGDSNAASLVSSSNGASKADKDSSGTYRGVAPLKAASSDLSYSKDSTATTGTIKISKGTYTVNVGSGKYEYALGFKVEFNNTSKKDTYAIYDLTVASQTFKVIAHSHANDLTDTSSIDNDVDEDGIIPVGGDTKYENGSVIYSATIKEMVEKGATYGINMKNGVAVIVKKVAKATAEGGNMTLNYQVKKDATLNDRYADQAGSKLVLLDVVSGFMNEKVKYNLDLTNKSVTDIIPESDLDKWSDGKKVYVYVVNKANLETAANASVADGLIDSERMITGQIVDGKVVFDVAAKYFDNAKEALMISLKEIDVAKLPAVPGVVVSDAAAANEITAPSIDAASAPVVAPAVVSAPVLDQAPATASAVANTGANDVVALAIALAAISMAAAGAVAYKKF